MGELNSMCFFPLYTSSLKGLEIAQGNYSKVAQVEENYRKTLTCGSTHVGKKEAGFIQRKAEK